MIKIEFICEKCKKARSVSQKWYETNIGNGPKVCSYCRGLVKQRQTLLERYGVTNLAKDPAHIEKIKRAWKERDIKSKMLKKRKATLLERYGTENINCEAWKIQKDKETRLRKYGNENYNNREKYFETCKQRYGECVNSTDWKKEKIKASCRVKYGKDTVQTYGSEERKKLMLQKYGVEFYTQTQEAQKYRRNRYTFENETFDSIPEFAFWKYWKDKNCEIRRLPCKFKYTLNDAVHYYFPDFEVIDENEQHQYYEIKGDQFLKEDGTWQNPFDHSLDNLYEAKHQCALKNGVEILYSKSYQMYINYIYDTYGFDFFKKYKTKKEGL